MPPKTLTQLATEACVANARNIGGFGDLLYETVRPILLKIDNAQHLREIEDNSPQICGADAEIWQALLKRDIRDWEKRKIEPKNPENWYKIYRKLKKEDEDRLREAQEKLKAEMDSRKAEKQNNQMGFIDKVINPKRNSITKPRTIIDRSGYMSTLHFGSGSRTSAATGKSTMNKVKRETREASVFGARKVALSTPTHLLNQNTTRGLIVGPTKINGTYGTVSAQVPLAHIVQAGEYENGTSSNDQTSTQPQPQPHYPRPQGVLRPSPKKRAASSVFMPAKKRRI